jgi:hypothetical protein
MNEEPLKEVSRSMVCKKNSEVRLSKAALRERRAKLNNYQLSYRLCKKTEERVRLTSQLIFLVNDVANQIAELADLDTTVKVKGVGVLSIVQWTCYVESRKVLVFDDPKTEEDDWDEGRYELPGAALGFDVEPASRFFFDGDLSAQGRAASREKYISFANNIPEIVNAFAAEEDAIIARLLSAFASLRHMVGST